MEDMMAKKNQWSEYQRMVLSDLKNLKEDIKDLSERFDRTMYGKNGIIRTVERHKTLFFIYGIVSIGIFSGLVKLAFF